MNALIRRYNYFYKDNMPSILARQFIKVPCKIKSLTSGSYGKVPQDDAAEVNFMEYSQFLRLVGRYLPADFQAYPKFIEYL
jgi:hypothetical protein